MGEVAWKVRAGSLTMGTLFLDQSEGGTFRTAYSIPGRGNGAGWGQILHRLLLLVRRAPGWPPLL